MLSSDQVKGSAQPLLAPWLFQVEPCREESFGHFLGRFRRANSLSSSQLSAMMGQRPYVVSYWESPSRQRRPGAGELRQLSQLSGVCVARLALMWSPPGTELHWPTRLCAWCYADAPWHRLSWQIASRPQCEVHQRQLLAGCPQCGSAFRLPSYWHPGVCDRCEFPFQEMRIYQDVVRAI